LFGIKHFFILVFIYRIYKHDQVGYQMKVNFKSQIDVIEALLRGEKVVNRYTGVVFFVKNNKIESGISDTPTANFYDFENYERYLAD